VRRFLVGELPVFGVPVSLEKEVSHHLLRVVGIAPKEEFELFDGRGKGCIALLDSVTNSIATVRFCRPINQQHTLASLWVLLALTKGDAFTTALRMLTELGVDHLVPVLTERSIVKGCKLPRWQKIVAASSAQSKRLTIPEVYPLCSLRDALSKVENLEQRYLLHPSGNHPLISIKKEGALLIGPEGGFSPKEIKVCTQFGWEVASIKSLVLRADTAAIVAATIAFGN